MEKKLNKVWLYFGYSFKRFSIGFTIDTYHLDIDLGFIWIGVEW
jgi:hypothetical protein